MNVVWAVASLGLADVKSLARKHSIFSNICTVSAVLTKLTSLEEEAHADGDTLDTTLL